MTDQSIEENDAFDVGSIIGSDLDGEWYAIPKLGKARVKIRPIKPSRLRRWNKECTRTKMKKGRPLEVVDVDKLSRLLVCEIIVEWEHIVMDGKPFPCTDQNKVLLDNNCPEFNDLWNDIIGQETEIGEALEDAELGN